MAIPLRDDIRTRRFPWVTVMLLAANVVVFLFVQPAGFQTGGRGIDPQETAWLTQQQDTFAFQWGTVACELTTGKLMADEPEGCDEVAPAVLPEEKSIPLALLTCMFLHGTVLHLAGNLLFLWVFGNNVEDRVGSANFLALYLIGGVVATLGFVATNAGATAPLIGASGAIAVAMGAYLVLFPRARVLTVIMTAAFQIVYVPAAVVLILYFVTQFFTADENIAWEAHAAGMAAGVVGALVLARVPAIRRRGDQDLADARLRLGSDF